MKRRKLTWLLTWGAALLPPLFLLALFELLKGDKSLMDAWVTGFMAPLEQFLGRVWSLLPWFSAAEALAALFLLGSAAGLIRAAALLVRDRTGWEFLGRLAAFGAVLLWLWAGVCWMWNAAYYASSFQEKSGLHTQPYSVDKLERVTALFAQRAAEFSVQVARDENGLFAEGREEIFSRRSGYSVRERTWRRSWRRALPWSSTPASARAAGQSSPTSRQRAGSRISTRFPKEKRSLPGARTSSSST